MIAVNIVLADGVLPKSGGFQYGTQTRDSKVRYIYINHHYLHTLECIHFVLCLLPYILLALENTFAYSLLWLPNSLSVFLNIQ